MTEKSELFKSPNRALLFYLFWLLSIAALVVLAHDSELALIAVFVLLAAFFICIRGFVLDKRSLNDVCKFYEQAHALDDLQVLQTTRPYSKILEAVIELGKFDWAVLFLMDYDKDRFVAVESAGISLDCFASVSFDDISTEQTSDNLKLSVKLLEHAFKSHEFRGALAGTTLAHNEVYYGCMLVGRHDGDAELTSEDNFKLDILSDQISICLHNYRLHNELAFRAEELALRQAQLQRELEMARIVQDGATPRRQPAIDGIEVASFLKPARFIGGDFLRYREGTSKDSLGILIGDVCGKGIPAALVMAVVVCLFKEKVSLELDPALLMSSVNVSLKEFLGAGSRFNSTAIWGVFDLQSMDFRYSSAGHDFPLLYSAATKTLVELESTGTLLGIFAESAYGTRTVQLADGDKILFYSDGLVDFFEAWSGCEDGYIYLQKFFLEHIDKTSNEIVKEISTLVENSASAVTDDITAAVFSIDRNRKVEKQS